MPLPIETTTPRSGPAEIPAECFNLLRLAQRRCGGRVELALPGLPGNYLRATDEEWRCWNRRLRTDLLSWDNFRTTARGGLGEPVACRLTVHHPYSRTIIHRVHDAATDYLRRLLAQHAPAEPGRVIAWPGARRAEDLRC
jgi:hypothetical protein